MLVIKYHKDYSCLNRAMIVLGYNDFLQERVTYSKHKVYGKVVLVAKIHQSSAAINLMPLLARSLF